MARSVTFVIALFIVASGTPVLYGQHANFSIPVAPFITAPVQPFVTAPITSFGTIPTFAPPIISTFTGPGYFTNPIGPQTVRRGPIVGQPQFVGHPQFVVPNHGVTVVAPYGTTVVAPGATVIVSNSVVAPGVVTGPRSRVVPGSVVVGSAAVPATRPVVVQQPVYFPAGTPRAYVIQQLGNPSATVLTRNLEVMGYGNGVTVYIQNGVVVIR